MIETRCNIRLSIDGELAHEKEEEITLFKSENEAWKDMTEKVSGGA